MTNAQSFPICRIPSVACDCVIQKMDLREKYILSTLSRRAGRAVRVASLREKYTLHIHIDEENALVCLKSHPSKNFISVGIYKIGSLEKSESFKNEVHVLWTEEFRRTFLTHVRSIVEVFRCKWVSMKIEDQLEPLADVQHLVTEIRRMNLRIFNIEVNDFCYNNNELFDFVWKNFRRVDTLVCYISTENYEWKITKPFSFRRCDFSPPRQFNMNHLIKLFMNCRILNVFAIESENLSDDLIKFLKKWMEGPSKLEYVRFKFANDLDFESIVRGVVSEPVEDRWDAVKILQRNGVEAVVYMEGPWNLVLTTYIASPLADADLWADDETIEDLEAMEIVDDVEVDTDGDSSDDEKMDDEGSDDEEEMGDEEDMGSDEDEFDESGNEDSNNEEVDSEEDGNDNVSDSEELDGDDA